MNCFPPKLLLLLLPLACAEGVAQIRPTEMSATSIVGRQTVVMTSPPKHVPSGTVVDGPILGNGDVGVVVGGPPDHVQFYIGKNDFWSQQASPMTVGGMDLDMPGLHGASYREEEDILHAETQGTFSTGESTVTAKSWVAATENLFVTELQATGNASLPAQLTLFPQGTAIINNEKHINIGREQHGNGRSYFNGLIDEVYLYDRALQPDEIRKLVNLEEPTKGLLRHWGFDEEEGTSPQDTAVKLITGPDCPGMPPVYRPDEAPLEEATACKPDGYHLDYQSYGVGKQGRAVKLMHGWDYIDAGDVPPVHQVSVAAWIYIFSAGDANYIVSKGEWNDAYSLCLDRGRLRFNVGERFVRSEDILPTHTWIHVVGTFDGKQLRAFIDAKETLPQARFVVSGSTAPVLWMSRNADGPQDEQYAWPNPLPPTTSIEILGRQVSVAVRVVGEPSTVADGGITFSLVPGKPVYLIASILSDLDAPNHLAAAQARAESVTAADIMNISETHRAWWQNYWSESYIDINDPVIEKSYYVSQYIMASASRSGKVAPGLYGPWVTTDHPSWNGDYTLDYNLQTPYLGLYSSNHIAVSDSYDPPVLDFLGRAETYARTMLNVRGVYYPGHIGPWGLERKFDYDPFMGMKGNAAFLAMPMLMRFYSTYDDTYSAKVYPYLRKVGDFWEDYLQLKDGIYVIPDDSPNEVGPWSGSPDWTRLTYGSINPTNDLAFVRATFKGLIDMSQELGMDAARRPVWQNVIDHLSSYPTMEQSGKLVFRGAEDSKRVDPALSTWAIWPGNQIGLGEDPKLLEVAKNTVASRGFSDFPLVPPAMARVGYDPAKLLEAMREDIQKNEYPNGYIFYAGGGVETASIIPATVDEMLLQSFSGVLRLFPVWPRNQDASFHDLRAYGAFLVSSQYKNGRVTDLTVRSEKGRDCALENPWPGKTIVLYRNGQKAETLTGSEVKFATARGETISIQPR